MEDQKPGSVPGTATDMEVDETKRAEQQQAPAPQAEPAAAAVAGAPSGATEETKTEQQQQQQKEEEGEDDEKKVDLGFVPQAGKLPREPRPNTTFLHRRSWLETCTPVLENTFNPTLSGTGEDLRRILDRVLTVCHETCAKDEEILPVKLCVKYFQQSNCLSILLSEVLIPMMTSMDLNSLNQLQLDDTSACVGIMKEFSKKLTDNAVQKKKKIFISSKLDQMEALDIKKLVVKLGGIIVPSSAFPGVTHIIASSSDESSAEGWMRAREEGRVRVMSDQLEKEGATTTTNNDMLFVHHVGYPCSHDEFLPASTLTGGGDLTSKVKFQGASMKKKTAMDRKDPWLVTPDWIKQSGLLHEWMFEPDFEAISREDFGDSQVEVVTTADLAQLEERSKILKQQQAEERKKRERERLEKEADLKIKKMKRDADERAEKAAKAARLQQEKVAKLQKLHAERAEKEKEKAAAEKTKAAERAEKEKAAVLFSRTQKEQQQQQQQAVVGAHSTEVAAMRTFAETHHTSLPPTEAVQQAMRTFAETHHTSLPPTEAVQQAQANTAAAASQQQQQQQQQVVDPTKVVGVTISSAGVASLSVKEGGIIPEHHQPFVPPGVIHPNSNDKMDAGERATRRELFRVPAHSAWFSWDSIHEIEKASMPEFFSNKSAAKTPKIYKEYRDFMIDMFREHPQRKLVFTQCRKFMVGDVNAIYRVFAFLEHWSLINFDPKQLSRTDVDVVQATTKSGSNREEEEKKKKEGDDFSVSKKEEFGVALPAELKVVKSQTGYNVDSLVNFKPVSVVNPMQKTKTGVWPLPLVTKKGPGVSGTSPADQVAKEVKFVCNISGKDCTNVRYHCTTIPDYDLSPESFEECKREKKFAPGMSEADFVRIDHATTDRKTDPGHWSKEEILLLLEGLEVFGENWAEVAEHVGTKSQLQCITYFISLPIEDPYLSELEGGQMEKMREGEEGTKGKGEEPLEPIPFADTGNPVMAQVAFLATMVGPKVAAAAAQKALSVLYETEPHVMANQKSSGEDKDKEGKDADGDETMKDANANGKEKEKEVSNTSEPPTSAAVKAAVATGLAAAAVKAKLLADKEEQEIQKLVIQVIEKQMLKLEMKMKNFEELDVLLQREREEIQKARHQLIQDKLAFQMKKIAEAKEAAAKASAAMAAPPPAPKITTTAPAPVASAPTPTASTVPSSSTAVQQPAVAPPITTSSAPTTTNPLPTPTAPTTSTAGPPAPTTAASVAKESSPAAVSPTTMPPAVTAALDDISKPSSPPPQAAPAATTSVAGPPAASTEKGGQDKDNKMDIDTTPK